MKLEYPWSELYPWSNMPMLMLKHLATTDPAKAPDQLVAELKHKLAPWHGDGDGDGRWVGAAVRTLEAVSRWLHGPRRLIEVTPAASKKLRLYPPRTASLNQEKPHWIHGAVIETQGILVYVEPFDQVAALVTVWTRQSTGLWGTVALSEEKGSWLHRYSLLENALQPHHLAIGERGERLPVGWVMHAAVNALAALHEKPEVIVGIRKRPTRHDKSGRVEKVHRLTLTEDGLAVVTRKWFTFGEIKEQEKMEAVLRSPACLHTVQPHTFKVWVRKPHSGEPVMASKESHTKRSSHLLHLVLRPRGKEGGYTRGSGVRPRTQKMVVGLDDL